MVALETEGLSWLKADVRDMPVIQDQSIDVAFDKGTLDAMIHGSPWNPPDDVRENSGLYMREVCLYQLNMTHAFTKTQSRWHEY